MENKLFINPINASQPFRVEHTGRFLMLSKEGDSHEKKIINRLKKAELNVASSGDYDNNNFSLSEALKTNDGVFFRRLGVTILNTQPHQEQVNTIAESSDQSNGFIIEPERVVYAIDALSTEYLQGYYDAVKYLYEKNQEGIAISEVSSTIATGATLGLESTRVLRSPYSGKGIKVAILDTGFHLDHPDFLNRVITSESFVKGEIVEDLNGHGTHCIGTSLGPKTSSLGIRYGIAYDGEIHAGKVLSNAGTGGDGDILNGIDWALANGCKIISMSLAARADPSKPNDFSPIFEQVAKRVLNQGTLIVAAAGNDSQRGIGQTAPVSHPANCPSIMAVAAVDDKLKVASFSNRGQIDIAGPGVNIYSSWKSPELVKTISGTSMATPHVAGIAALWLEANPNASAYQLWQLLTQNARRLDSSALDVGSGLVQAPI